jgi:nicotinamide riboside kinase
MKLSALITLLLLATLFGCKDSASKNAGAPPQSQSSASSALVETTHNLIAKYNSLLSEGYKTTDMTKLQEVTTPELAEKAYYHMAAIGEGKSRMVSELKKLDFIETDCSKPSTCRVVTKEIWDFAYADILTGVRSNEVKDYRYDVQYLLENRQGRWLIIEITATGEERKELPAWNKMFKKQ